MYRERKAWIAKNQEREDKHVALSQAVTAFLKLLGNFIYDHVHSTSDSNIESISIGTSELKKALDTVT